MEADGKLLNQWMFYYLSYYFSNKIQDLCDGMDLRYEDELSSRLIKDRIMSNKPCKFKF